MNEAYDYKKQLMIFVLEPKIERDNVLSLLKEKYKNYKVKIKFYSNALTLYRQFLLTDVDEVYAKIETKGMTGYELINLIHKQNKDVKLFFISEDGKHFLDANV